MGVPIRLHVSWVLLLLFGVMILQPQFTRVAGSSGWPMAFLTTLLLLLAIVLHELGHALMARRLGKNVQSITLFLTGGITELQDDLEHPAAEFKIALAGPLVSIALTLICAGLALVTSGAYYVLWMILAGSNGLLAVFNLLPCYPLDGGRVLRAMLWFLHDDLLRGTAVAANVARLLGNTLILLGVIVLLSADVSVGLVAMVLGWIANRAAVGNYLQTALHYSLSRISVRELMSGVYRTVAPQITLDLFVGQYLLGQTEQGFPVVQAERCVGLITRNHLRPYMMHMWSEIRVDQVMTPTSALPSISPDDSAQSAYLALVGNRFDQLPVLDGGRILGMIRYRDVVNFVQQSIQRSQSRA